MKPCTFLGRVDKRTDDYIEVIAAESLRARRKLAVYIRIESL